MRDSIQPTQPLMPEAGREIKPQERSLRTSLSKARLLAVAKAKISRRKSLRKQRAALKN
jgi:hypothetical protein